MQKVKWSAISAQWVLGGVFFISSSYLCAEQKTNEPIHINITMNNHSMRQLDNPLLHEPILCTDVINIISKPKERGAADLIIACKALTLEGLHIKITLNPSPSYDRTLMMVESGEADMSASTIWPNDVKHNLVAQSLPTLSEGEFQKGVYTLQNHPLQKTAPNEISLKNYTAVTIKKWHHDIELLKQLSTTIVYSDRIPSVYKMLKAKRADYTILEFGNTGVSTSFSDDITLYRVPGVYVILKGSRHYIISKKSPHLPRLKKALDAGISKLKKSGEITAIYKHAGVSDNTPQKKVLIQN